mgnify:CR=1 FL=1
MLGVAIHTLVPIACRAVHARAESWLEANVAIKIAVVEFEGVLVGLWLPISS